MAISSQSSNTESFEDTGYHSATRTLNDEPTIDDSDIVAPIASNETYLDLDDDDFKDNTSDKQQYKYWRLELNNRGTFKGKWSKKEKRRRQDDWYRCQAIASQLGLPDSLKQPVWEIFDDTDLRKYKRYEDGPRKCEPIQEEPTRKYPTRKQDLVIFCICVLMHNERQADSRWEYYPGKKYEDRSKYGGGGSVGVQRVENIDCEKPQDCHHLLVRWADDQEYDPKLVQGCMEMLKHNHPERLGNHREKNTEST